MSSCGFYLRYAYIFQTSRNYTYSKNKELKHQPFGWIKFKNKNENGYIHFEVISDYGISFNPDTTFTFKEMFERYTFLDGDLFGMKSKVRNLSQKQRPFPKIVRK